MNRRPFSRKGGRDGGGRRGGGRFSGGFRDEGSPSEVTGKEKSGMEEDISPLKSLSESPSSQENKTSKKEKYNTIVFLDFKDYKYGVLHFGAVRATSKFLIPVTELSFRLNPTREGGTETFRFHYLLVYSLLNREVVIGYDIKSQLQKLEDVFRRINEKPPKVKKTIDTLPFIRSKTELAKVAIKHGLGKKTYYGRIACLANLNAIAKCSTAMSSTKKAVHGVNPIIRLIEKSGTEESGTQESGQVVGTNEEEEEDFKLISGLGMYFGGSSPQYCYVLDSREPPSSQDPTEDIKEDFFRYLHGDSLEVETEKIQSARQPVRRSQRLMDKEAMKDKDKSAGGR